MTINLTIKETIFFIFQRNKWIKNSIKMLFRLDGLPSYCEMLDERAGFSKRVQMFWYLLQSDEE